MEETEKIIYKHALQNANAHKGSANPKAVIGSIMSNEPELRKQAKTISQLTPQIVQKVNDLTIEQQQKEIETLGINTTKKQPKKKNKGLTELPGTHENIKLRFAPNPSGPLHIGHARAAVLNNEYAKKYNGKLILRIEDTDPKRVYEPAYQMIPEDLDWLNIKYEDEIIIQSDRLEIYYEYAEKAIKKGIAYVCTCNSQEFKTLKDACKPCPCRNLTIEENLERWEQFPTMEEGSAVLRIKTDINHKNPAIRDWAAMRIEDTTHPRTGNKYRLYPMMNFSVVIDDHLLGITHVLRGKDHLANSEKQKYLYDYFDWEIPEFIHYGRLKMEDIALSTSQAKEGIETQKYSGWDDPRLGTLRAIAKRGITPQSLQKLMTEIGTKIADSTISWKKIYGLNRQELEKTSNRYFFVPHPELVTIPEIQTTEIIERPLHPDFPERGNREIPFNGKVYLDKNDLKQDNIIRLMDAANIKLEKNTITYHSKTFEEARSLKAKIIQWVPAEENIKTKIIMEDTTIIEGLAEPSIKNIKIGEIIQFERFGFLRLNEKTDDQLIFYFAHK